LTNSLSVLAPQNTALSNVDDKLFDDLTRNKGYLGRMQLYSKGSAINHGLVGPGEYGIPDGDDKIIRLGKNVDVLPLARRVKALDMSDKENIISVYDPKDPEFARIRDKAGEKDSGCMFGVSFLVFERTTGRFLEFFCGTKTSRAEAGKIYDFLPQVDKNGVPQPPRAITLGSRVIDSGSYSWHGSTIAECSTPISNLPSIEELQSEINSFQNPRTEKAEKVDEAAVSNRRAR
jgi:hypothetical protein